MARSFSKNAPPDQFGPGGGGAGRSGHQGLAVADFEHAAEEVEHVRIGLEARHGDVFAELLGGFAAELGNAEIQAAEGGIGEEHVEEAAGFLFLGGEPIVGTEQDGNARGVVVVGKRTVSAEGLFEGREGEAGIGGQKSAGGVDGFEDDFAAASAAHTEAQNAQQVGGVGGIASLDIDDFRGAGELLDFTRLRDITMDELEIFGLF